MAVVMDRVLTTFLLALVVLAVALARTSPHLAVPSGDEVASRDAISDLIENIRKIIREGSEDLNIPVLDPLQIESQDLNLNEDGAYAVKAGLRNVVSTGLGDFEADVEIKNSLIFLRVTIIVDISLPHLNANGQYSLDALLGEVVNLYGNGNFEMDLTELNATIVTDITVGPVSSSVRKVTSTLNVGDIKLSADGLLEGGPVDDVFNLAMNEIAKVIFDSQKSVLEDYLSSLLVDPINEVIKDFGLKDILCLLFGTCGGNEGDDDDAAISEDRSAVVSGDAGGSSNGGDASPRENGGAFADNVYIGAGVRDRLNK